LIKFKKLREKM